MNTKTKKKSISKGKVNITKSYSVVVLVLVYLSCRNVQLLNSEILKLSNVLFHVNKVILQSVLGDSAFADFQFCGRIVVDIVDTHFIANGKST